MSMETEILVGAVGLFLIMLVGFEYGHRVGKDWAEKEDKTRGVNAVEGAVFALFGLVLAFSFSSASDRLEHRRELVVREASAIEVAFMRLDLLPDVQAATMRVAFRDYVDARINIYRDYRDENSFGVDLLEADRQKERIWDELMKGRLSNEAALLVVPAVNEMFDSGTARTVALQTHLPWLITAFLVGLAVISAVLAGRALYGPKGGWFHRMLFSAVIALTVYVVIDLDHPRSGFIRVGAAEQAFKDLREEMMRDR
ncbi:MAG: hypothetical protein K1X67_01805 [Fimbriimonadaceae bacterium]|nr:hypothetical protein [Fimbriimonadaceae bacterium]